MKDKTTFRKMLFFPINSSNAIKEELERLALKGWKLKNVNIFYEFEKIEPQKLYYYVDFFPTSSIYDTKPEYESIDYIEYCKQAGWEFTAMMGNMYIFVSEKENLVPIQTDEELKFKSINKSMLKHNALNWGVLPILLLLNLFVSVLNFERFITSNLSLVHILNLVFIIPVFWGDFAHYLYWRIKNRRRLNNGKSIEFTSSKTAKKIVRIRISIILSVLIGFPAIIFFLSHDKSLLLFSLSGILMIIVFLAISYIWQKQKFGRSENIIFTIVMPLVFSVSIGFISFIIFLLVMFSIPEAKNNTIQLSDFGISNSTDYELYIDKSILASEETLYTDSYANSFIYTIFRSNHRWIISKYAKKYFDTEFYEKYIPDWKANKVIYSEYTNETVVIYDNVILTYSGNIDLSSENIKNIRNRLLSKEIK